MSLAKQLLIFGLFCLCALTAQAVSFQPGRVYYLCDPDISTPFCEGGRVNPVMLDSGRTDSVWVLFENPLLDEPLTLGSLKSLLERRDAGAIHITMVSGKTHAGERAAFRGDTLWLDDRAFPVPDVGRIRWEAFEAEAWKFATFIMVGTSAATGLMILDVPLMSTVSTYGFPYAMVGLAAAGGVWMAVQRARGYPRLRRRVYLRPLEFETAEDYTVRPLVKRASEY